MSTNPCPRERQSFKEFAAVLVISGILGIGFVYALADLAVLILAHPMPYNR